MNGGNIIPVRVNDRNSVHTSHDACIITTLAGRNNSGLATTRSRTGIIKLTAIDVDDRNQLIS